MKKILLVSSSKSFLARNRNLLTREDFQITTSLSGGEALQLHQEQHFDLIMADLHLHDMGGDTLCTNLCNGDSTRNVAFILICYDKADEHARVVQSGADAKIIRPVQPEQIIDTVGSLLDMQLGRTKRAMFTVKVVSKKGAVEFYCFSRDISITGILLATEYHLDIGDRIICQFTLPGAEQIAAEGDVVRSVKAQESTYLYGVQFVGLPLSSRRVIDNFVVSSNL